MSRAFSIDHFSATYAQARDRFAEAAKAADVDLRTLILPGYRGREGEKLTLDVAYLGRRNAEKVLILSSGVHGPEGFCGSACQTALLCDDSLMQRIRDLDIGVLLLHAVNPYGFSWLHRTNESNIDLNRNAVPFPFNKAPDLRAENFQELLIGFGWPRTTDQQERLDAYCEEQGGMAALWKILSTGQYHDSAGLFYGGTQTSWSISVIREVLPDYVSAAEAVAWVDIHTGLGPYGHGEKICPGRSSDLSFTRMLWGSDLAVPSAGRSVSGGVSGSIIKMIYEFRPQAQCAIMGLEFGTLPYEAVLESIAADAWVRSQENVTTGVRDKVARLVRDAFFCDHDDWKGYVLGQARMVLMQAVIGLAEYATTEDKA